MNEELSTTEVLCRLLTERGVECEEYEDDTGHGVCFGVGNDDYWAYARGVGTGFTIRAVIGVDTPEQVVEATLGRGTCHMEPSFTEPGTVNDIQEYLCSECGSYCVAEIDPFTKDDREDKPRFCPYCGREVVE